MHLQDIKTKYFLKIYNNYFMKDFYVWIAYGLGFNILTYFIYSCYNIKYSTNIPFQSTLFINYSIKSLY